jgi:hypothetical protein
MLRDGTESILRLERGKVAIRMNQILDEIYLFNLVYLLL